MIDTKALAHAHMIKIGAAQSSSLSSAAQKLVRVLSKKGKGTLDINALTEVMEAIDPKWDFREDVGVQKLDSDRLQGLFRKRHGVLLRNLYSGDKRTEIRSFDNEEAKAFQGRPDVHLEVRREPSNPKMGHVYMEKWEEEPREDGRVFTSFGTVWYGVPVWEVTAPSGKRVQIVVGIDTYGDGADPASFKSAALWKFLYDHGAQEGSESLLIEAPAMRIMPSKLRDLTNTGTCPVCTNNQKLRGDRMVDHGYVIPRFYSMRQKSCFGVGYPPYELSSKGCVAYRKALLNQLEKTQEDLQAVANDEKVLLDRSKKPMPRDHKNYAYYKEEVIRGMQSDIKYLNEDIKTMDARIKTWKVAPLPGDD